MATKEVVAAGFIVFRRIQSQLQYLIMKHSYGNHWTPPKGHVDPGEGELEAAYRETFEEAGLSESDLKVFEGCKQTLKYEVKGRPKRVEYWVAELCDPDTPVRLSHEHETFEWLPLENVLLRAGFQEMQQAFKNVDSFLKAS
ncbi:hypothetical protein CAPTEDRAFT_170524 [Capitella teleta]|uniref:Bis(5'-nucleosyl)-tetraphosphatase [asymmetrical] n=1 Tax=Capitella teleta TaxID=283909 RepID=R7TZT5_CAPTE|nr:hypothetical protein CAPTEDRAFT_170524 [Capitella teleta]|eukprot:ELT96450.1 hypothetical protein CAPTEDRAFT_170524 [Capitella teleta]